MSLLDCPSEGFFLDLAANDAHHLSNTVWLEEFGWNGICIEPNPQYHAHHALRKCQTVSAVVESPATQTVKFKMDGYMGGIIGYDQKDGSHGDVADTPTVSLESILRRYNAPRLISYFSLDVEGAESKVLSYFPWDEYTFLVLTIERPPTELKNKLVSKGYVFLRSNSHFRDETWIHKSLHGTLHDPEKKFSQSCMAEKGYPNIPKSCGSRSTWKRN